MKTSGDLVLQGEINSVYVDKSLAHSRHEQLLNRFIRTAIPFAYGFYHIITDYKLEVIFADLPLGQYGSFGYPKHNSFRRVRIQISVDPLRIKRSMENFFHEMTHFHQFLDDRLHPNKAAYRLAKNAKERKALYLNDPLEREARENAIIMMDSFARFRSNYRWNVPCSPVVFDGLKTIRIVDHRSPLS